MIRLPDDYVVQLARGMLSREEYSEAVTTLQGVNSQEARDVIGAASYALGNQLASEGAVRLCKGVLRQCNQPPSESSGSATGRGT